MQTFLPYSDITESLRVLDNKRLGKQRVETFQIINAITGRPKLDGTPYKGWLNHPCSVMWRKHVPLLKMYLNASIDEWVNRYGKDAEHIVEIAFALWPEISEKEWVPDIAELHYAIHYEMCLHPSDFFVRRTSNLYFNRENLMRKFEILYPWFIQIAQLNNESAKQYEEQFINEIGLALDFK